MFLKDIYCNRNFRIKILVRVYKIYNIFHQKVDKYLLDSYLSNIVPRRFYN